MMDDVELEQAQRASEEARALLADLDRELSVNYSPEQRHGLAVEAVFQPHIRFFIARRNRSAVGCGGVALFPDFGEVKRMYVRPAARGTGVADAILHRLAAEAIGAGTSFLRLETGTHQVAAIAFYRRCGFKRCDAFEPYSSMPAQAIATSIFLERELSVI